MELTVPHPRLTIYFSVGLAVLALLLLVATGANGLVAAGLCLGGWLLYYTSRVGQEISPDGQFTRAYFGWPGMRLGTWQPMPLVTGVTLKYFAHRGSGPKPSRNSWAVWDTSESIYEELVLLFSVAESTTGFIVGRYSLGQLALVQAQGRAAAQYLGVPFRAYVPPHAVSLP